METINFKIRLALYGIEDNKQYFLDEHLDEVSELNLFNCEFNWIADNRLWHKLYFGFNDDDVIMDVKYENGLYNITLITDDNFSKHITVMSSSNEMSLITRTLLDWVKISINGHLSDGIGENEIGSCIFKNTECDVWLSSIITDEPTDKYGFVINDPIHVETDKNIIDQYLMPDYIDEYSKLSEQYKQYMDNKDYAGMSRINELMKKSQQKNIEYILNALKTYKYN